MEPQQTNPINPIEATPSSPPDGIGRLGPWLITGIIIVATGLVVGGGVYGAMSKRLASERTALERRITDLQNQIAQQPTSTADWKIFDQEKEGVRKDVLPNFKFPKLWYTFNISGGAFTEINFSDGGNLVKRNLGGQTIESKLYELYKPQENECRLSIGVSAEDGGYAKVDDITEHNSKTNDDSRRGCNMILSTLRQQIQNQKTAR